jgi:hypothetical protein
LSKIWKPGDNRNNSVYSERKIKELMQNYTIQQKSFKNNDEIKNSSDKQIRQSITTTDTLQECLRISFRGKDYEMKWKF